MKFDQLHSTGENQQLEFKESFGKETAETVTAFSNASGGTIMIGVDKTGNIKGVTVTGEILKEWVNNIKQATQPQIYPEISSYDVDGKTVVAVKVQEYPIKPVGCKGKSGELMQGNYIAVHRNKLLAEAFYLRGDIEKFGTGFFRIQSELQNSPEIRFTVESLNGFTRSGLEVTAQVTHQDTPQDKNLAHNAIGHDRLGNRLGDRLVDTQDTHQDTPQDKHLAHNAIGHDRLGDTQDTHQDTHQVPQDLPQVPQDTHQDTHQDEYEVYIQAILGVLNGELNRIELQNLLGLKDKVNFRLLYLKPALESGLIEMTIPGKPNSKYQKYRLTEKGKRMKNNKF